MYILDISCKNILNVILNFIINNNIEKIKIINIGSDLFLNNNIELFLLPILKINIPIKIINSGPGSDLNFYPIEVTKKLNAFKFTTKNNIIDTYNNINKILDDIFKKNIRIKLFNNSLKLHKLLNNVLNLKIPTEESKFQLITIIENINKELKDKYNINKKLDINNICCIANIYQINLYTNIDKIKFSLLNI